MSEQDGSTLRLPNALATLAELSGQHDERPAKLDEISKQHHSRIASSEEAIRLLLELRRTAGERADDRLIWINQFGAAQAKMSEKMAALADARMRAGAKFERLAEQQARADEALAEAMRRIAESQERSDRRLEGLADLVRGRLQYFPKESN